MFGWHANGSFVHGGNDGFQNCRIRRRVDAVAEIEDVPWVGAIVDQHRTSSSQSGIVSGQNQSRVEISLNDQAVTHTSSSVSNRRSPVESENVWASCLHRLEKVIASDTEMDARHIGMQPRQLGEDVRTVWSNERVVILSTQRTSPGIEELKSASAGTQLGVDESDGMLCEPIHEVVPQCRIARHHRFGVNVMFRRPTLDQVTGHGEGSPSKGQ